MDGIPEITEPQSSTPSAKDLDERAEKLLYAVYSYWLTNGKNWDTLPDNIKEILNYSQLPHAYLCGLVTCCRRQFLYHSARLPHEYLCGLATRLPEEKQLRTRAKSGLTTNYPRALITNTAVGYENSITLRESGNAYMMKLYNMEGLKFEDGKLYFEGLPEETTIEVVRNLRTMEGIERINLPLLRYFYSIIYQQFEATGVPDGKLSLYIPDLARAIGHKGNTNDNAKHAILKAIHEFNPLIGCIGKSLWAVLLFHGYDAETNTISFSSPYMEMVIRKTIVDSMKRDKRGKIIENKSGVPLVEANHSRIVKKSIIKEKNKHAANNVIEIVRIIEQAGNNTPHVSARWLLENNTQFLEAFRNKIPEKRTIFVKSVFKKTLQLLRTHTRLEEVYRDIELPDPDDAANIPTQKTLKSVVYSFPHKGKRGKKQ